MTNKFYGFSLSLILTGITLPVHAQFGPPQVDTVDNARAASPFDPSGIWVSVVTEDWRYRMITAERGDAEGIFLTDLGQQVADSWDPQADSANGEACKAYGAAGIMRQPTRLRISWEDDNVLKIETDAGMQTRLLKFGAAQDGAGAGTWQGVSNAAWNLHRQGRGGPAISGTIEVQTSGMRPGYLRRNGIPYSDQARMQEYFDVISGADGTEYLVVVSIVEDPVFLAGPVMTSTNFKRETDDSRWSPSACIPD